jgi:hypothetical protein
MRIRKRKYLKRGLENTLQKRGLENALHKRGLENA